MEFSDQQCLDCRTCFWLLLLRNRCNSRSDQMSSNTVNWQHPLHFMSETKGPFLRNKVLLTIFKKTQNQDWENIAVWSNLFDMVPPDYSSSKKHRQNYCKSFAPDSSTCNHVRIIRWSNIPTVSKVGASGWHWALQAEFKPMRGHSIPWMPAEPCT